MGTEIKYRLKFLFQQIDVLSAEFIIGRAQDCNLTLEDPLVSRNHARIRTGGDGPAIDDLGSRNGTLVNGIPIFNNHPLYNNDRIRIGSHDLLFIAEKPGASRAMRTTGAMITCNSCKIPLSLGLSHCPHCNAPVGLRQECPHCHETVSPTEKYCPRCRTRLHVSDPTVPIGLGGNVEGWTDGMISEVIEKAIAQGRYDHAAKTLAGKIENYEVKRSSGTLDIEMLQEISRHSALLSQKLQEPERLEWILAEWQKTEVIMPRPIFEAIATNATFARPLEGYLALLRQRGVSESLVHPLEELRHPRSPEGNTP